VALEAAPDIEPSPRFRGGQTWADRAVARFEVSGYAGRRNEVLPRSRRGASGLSPYIRHGLLSLPRAWDTVAGGPARDVEKFRDELLWQEYGRHLYARLGPALALSLRAEGPLHRPDAEPFSGDMACVESTVDELVTDGWLVNQTRMWLASHWSVRGGGLWREGEDLFFRHLLDGSRAANRTGWQWTIGTATGKPYGFSRWQVEKRAPGLCDNCAQRDRCPIESWPTETETRWLEHPEARLRYDPDADATGGPREVVRSGQPDAVWITAESLGDGDPALVAQPDLPAVFVFDEPLLQRLRLSGKRLVFLAETLADLATRRAVEVHLGDPVTVLADRACAVTFAPVPGWRQRSRALGSAVVEVHPWPWLRRPTAGSVTSFSAWRPRR
jgi:deoxyribodipyrimidine photo-lyase